MAAEAGRGGWRLRLQGLRHRGGLQLERGCSVPKTPRRVFLAYAPDDASWAATLRNRLAHSGFDVYPSVDWPADVAGAIKRADFLIPLMSRRTSKSMWVQREIEQAIVSPHLKDRIFTVFMESAVGSPWVLRSLPSVTESNASRAADKVAQFLKKTA